MNTQTSEPVIVSIPRNETMATEPARAIAKLIELRLAIAGIIATLGVALAPQFWTDVDTVIKIAVPIVLTLYSVWQSYRQGEQTRGAVYSPAAAAVIAEAPRVEVLPGDPKYMPDLRETARTTGRPHATGRA